jgi:uncharacterized protein
MSSLDILRGGAILAILLANITHFANPVFTAMSPDFVKGLPEPDQWLAALRETFISGKARSLLCILFGVGLWLQFKKREAEPGKWPNSYFRRMGFLMVIGLGHALLVWMGDILTAYSLTAILAAAIIVKLSDKVLLWIIGMGLGLGLFMGSALTLVFALMSGQDRGSIFDNAWQNMMLGQFLNPANETAIFQSGGYFLQVVQRMVTFQATASNLIVLAPILLSLFTLGFLLARRGFLDPATRRPSDVRWLAILGLGIGVPVNALPLILKWRGVDLYTAFLIEFVGGPMLAMALFALGMVWAPRFKGAVFETFRRLGQVSLSVYLCQSALGCFVFYSPGLGLFGKLTLGQTFLVVLAIWAVNIAFAWFWTSRWKIGPVEWAWRSLEVGMPLPFEGKSKARGPGSGEDTKAAPA